MATSTTNLGLIKPAGSDKIRIAQINQNMDLVDAAVGPVGSASLQAQANALKDGLAIVSNNNTHAAITSGQYVYVYGHGTLTEGLYVATTNIGANGTLSGSNLTAVSGGGLNALNSKIDTGFATHDFGNNTLANIQSAIVTYAGSMSNYQSKPIAFALSEISGSMPVTAYVGFLFRVAATRLTVNIRQSMNANCEYVGNYKDGTWYWAQLALKDDYVPMIKYDDYLNPNESKTYTLPSNTKVAFVTVNNGNGQQSAWVIGMRTNSEPGIGKITETHTSSTTIDLNGMNFTVTPTYATRIEVLIF